MSLVHLQREADGEAQGLLVLHHGRGADEQDLLGLADVFDPGKRLHVVTPRAPLTVPGWPGYHWYVVPRVGYPDQATFDAAFAKLTAFHDELWERTGLGPERTIFGGFSMGAVMSHATGLAPNRPKPAGIMALSGFIPTVTSFTPDVSGAASAGTKVFLAHGRRDPVISVQFARAANDLFKAGGVDVEYHESDAGHYIEPTQVPTAVTWVNATFRSPAGPR